MGATPVRMDFIMRVTPVFVVNIKVAWAWYAMRPAWVDPRA